MNATALFVFRFSQTTMERYKSFANWLRNTYGTRVQKISINLNLQCPNRDGTKGYGGCIYCDNYSYMPSYTLTEKSVEQQIDEGIKYFQKKYPTQLYIAYFQNFTNTYGNKAFLYECYNKALKQEKIIGLAISTRPDCLDDEIINIIKEINLQKKVFVEIGIESTLDKTLIILNRCHSYQDVIEAVYKLHDNNLWCTGHLILGLPGETKETAIEHANKISKLPINCIKLHQLQILKNTALHKIYINNPSFVKPLSLEEYIDWVVVFLENLSPNIYIERFTSESPKDKVIAPDWKQIKNYHVVELIRKKLSSLNTYQGRLIKILP